MARRRQTHRHVAEAHAFLMARRLRFAGERFAIAHRHDRQRFRRRQNPAMAGAGVIGMAVRDHRAIDGAHGIDEEIAARAIKPFRARLQQRGGGHGGAGSGMRAISLISTKPAGG